MYEDEIQRLMQHDAARVWALDPNGTAKVPLPPELGLQAEPDDVSDPNPLRLIKPQSQGLAVIAFDRARREGSAQVTLERIDDEGYELLTLFNMAEQYGCFVGVALPTEVGDQVEAGSYHITPRRCTIELNTTGTVSAVSAELTAMLGWSADELLGRSALEIVHDDFHEETLRSWVDTLSAPGGAVRARRLHLASDGRTLWCEVTAYNKLQEDPAVVVLELVDVSREMAAQESLARREALLDRLAHALPSGVLFFGRGGQTSFRNARWQELTGHADAKDIQHLLPLIEEGDELAQAVEIALASGNDADLAVTFRPGSGTCRFAEVHLRPLVEADGQTGLLITLDDVTATRAVQDRLTDQTRRDPLTGLYNRHGIEEAMTKRLQSPRGTFAQFAVLFVDMDLFKQVNDTCGHQRGDEVLRAVGDCINDTIRTTDTLGRIGGDEFIVILDGRHSHKHVAAMSKRIERRLREMPVASTLPVEIGGSVGFAFARPDDDVSSLLERADRSMYQRKREHQEAAAIRVGVRTHSQL